MKMKLPEGVTGFGAGGIELEVHDGVVEIPAQYYQVALDHGLTAYDPASGKKSKRKADPLKVGDKVSLRFEGDSEDTVGEIKELDSDVATVESEQTAEPFQIDVKFLTKLEG